MSEPQPGTSWQEDAALARADRLRRLLGIWPGVIRHTDGTRTLTFDPEVTR